MAIATRFLFTAYITAYIFKAIAFNKYLFLRILENIRCQLSPVNYQSIKEQE